MLVLALTEGTLTCSAEWLCNSFVAIIVLAMKVITHSFHIQEEWEIHVVTYLLVPSMASPSPAPCIVTEHFPLTPEVFSDWVRLLVSSEVSI